MHLQFFFFRFSVCIQRQRRRSGEVTVFWRRSWLFWWKVLPSSVFMRQVWKVTHQVHTVAPIERFHSRGQHLYKLIWTKERVYIWKKNNRIGLEHQHAGHRFIVLEHQYGRCDVMWKRCIGHFRVTPSLCFKTRLSAKPLIWTCFFILLQVKFIYSRKVLHFDSFRKWELLELRNEQLLMLNNFCVSDVSEHLSAALWLVILFFWQEAPWPVRCYSVL